MKEQFRITNFRPDSLAKIRKMVEIVEEYHQDQGLRLTARQLYYQFVSRGVVANTEAEYKKFTALLSDARYAGLVDWEAIEDRGRVPERHAQWRTLKGLVDSALYGYRLPRWETQPCYVELWVEKQALAGVLAPIADEFHVVLMANKGYSSSSAMYESAGRIKENSDKCARDTVVFYLGDLDPSGEDMVRDVGDRLREFGCLNLDVKKIALTMEQVRKYKPPPNPAKLSDSRASAYVAKHGKSSWEVDALSPDVLARLIRAEFSKVVDEAAMARVKAREESDKDRLRGLVDSIT